MRAPQWIMLSLILLDIWAELSKWRKGKVDNIGATVSIIFHILIVLLLGWGGFWADGMKI